MCRKFPISLGKQGKLIPPLARHSPGSAHPAPSCCPPPAGSDLSCHLQPSTELPALSHPRAPPLLPGMVGPSTRSLKCPGREDWAGRGTKSHLTNRQKFNTAPKAKHQAEALRVLPVEGQTGTTKAVLSATGKLAARPQNCRSEGYREASSSY